MDKSSLLKVFTICFYCCTSISTVNCTRNKLLLLVFSGFRHDYTELTETPNFDRFKSAGTSVNYMEGVFPTTTVPSFFSIATGLYPESHGLVGDIFYDQGLKKTLHCNLTETPPLIEAGEPIWKTAKNQQLLTKIDFNTNLTTFANSVEPVIELLEFVDFMILFFDEPRKVGYKTGPKSSETIDMIKSCDKIIGLVLDNIDKKGLEETVNIIILSDHGMTTSDTNNVKHIEEFSISPKIETIVCDDGFCNILPKNESTVDVFEHYKDTPHVNVFRKEDLPDNLHYKENTRILPIVLIADEGWSLVAKEVEVPLKQDYKGSYGHNNSLMSMKPFFMAKGPDIKRNYTNSRFSQVDVYPLMCKLLHLNGSAQINGSLKEVGTLITNSTDTIGTSTIMNENTTNKATVTTTTKIPEPTTKTKITESTSTKTTVSTTIKTAEPKINKEATKSTATKKPDITTNNETVSTTTNKAGHTMKTTQNTTPDSADNLSSEGGIKKTNYASAIYLLAIGSVLGVVLLGLVYYCNTKCFQTNKRHSEKDKFPYLGYEIVKSE